MIEFLTAPFVLFLIFLAILMVGTDRWLTGGKSPDNED